MADYADLGYCAGGLSTAALDTTGNNAGNLTNALTPEFIGINCPIFEVYKMTVSNVPGGGQATIYRDLQLFSFVFPLVGSEWDPSQPMFLRPGQGIYFYWNLPAATTPKPWPQVTAFFRYDTQLPANRGYTGRG